MSATNGARKGAFLREITGSAHDIVSRLQEIDPDYRLFYNVKSKKFELHSHKGGELLIVFPYTEIDARMVSHARRTRVERIEEILAEIERENSLVEERAEHAAQKQANDNLRFAADKAISEQRRNGY